MVTKPGDNKSDPNLETLTYGLFSTCEAKMRSGIVHQRRPHLFFTTRRNGRRELVGYYRIRWYASAISGRARDYYLAADQVRFIAVGIPLEEVDRICGTDLSKPFRTFRLLSPPQCRMLKQLIERRPDATEDYLQEIERLERFNLKHGGHRYVGWRKSDRFSWQAAGEYLAEEGDILEGAKVVNASPSGLWLCAGCQEVIKNKALLRRCPGCGRIGTLRPEPKQEEGEADG